MNGQEMERVNQSSRNRLIPSAIWVLAIALAALIASPYWREKRPNVYYPEKATSRHLQR